MFLTESVLAPKRLQKGDGFPAPYVTVNKRKHAVVKKSHYTICLLDSTAG